MAAASARFGGRHMPSDLIVAIRSGKLASVRAALAAEPEAARHPQAIGAAAGRAFLPALRLLHRAGADVNASWKNYRPLHNVIHAESHENKTSAKDGRACLDWLLKHGANPELLAGWPAVRPLILAAFIGKGECVKLLIASGARRDGFTAAALGDLEALKAELRRNPKLMQDRDGGVLTALQCAAGSRLAPAKTLEAARILLDAGADPRALTRSYASDIDAAHLAVSSGNLPLYELLMDRGADATASLSPAVWRCNWPMAEAALSRGAKPERAESGHRPLLSDLVRWGQFEAALWLLPRQRDLNVADKRGWTALHQAASRGNLRMVQALIAAGADLSRRHAKGATPLDIARAGRKPKIVAALT